MGGQGQLMGGQGQLMEGQGQLMEGQGQYNGVLGQYLVVWHHSRTHSWTHSRTPFWTHSWTHLIPSLITLSLVKPGENWSKLVKNSEKTGQKG